MTATLTPDEILARAEALAGMTASEAVESLEGNFAEGNIPDDARFEFPGPVAEAYYWDDADVVAIQGPVGSGKTTTKMRRKLRRARMMPRSVIDGVRYYKVLFVRETYRQLWATVIPSYLETFPKALGQWSGGRGDPVRHHIRFADEFGEIDFVAEFMAFGDDIAASLRGLQVTDLDISEADTNPLETLTFGVGRINRYPARQHFEGYADDERSYGQIDCDFNAPDEDNWTFKVFHDDKGRQEIAQQLTATLPKGSKPIRFNFHRQPGYGEPGTENLQNLAPGYYELQIGLNKLAGKSDVTARMVYNKTTYLRAGDPVFSREFNRRIHVAETQILPDPALPLLVGLDQGFKGAAVLGQFDTPHHWTILAELHFPSERLMAAEFGRRLAELISRRFGNLRLGDGWGDMAGEQGASQAADENATWNKIVGQAAGFRVRPQRIGTNRIQPRLEAVRASLEFVQGGRPGLLIDPSCKFLIRGFEARYVWKDEVDASGDKRKVPDKSLTEANVMDGFQYLALSQHKANGLSRISFPYGHASPEGQGGGTEWGRPQDPAGGLRTGYDVLHPYGE
ncbi:MAG: hypothetical protein V4720_10605 [Pseudomonadota bacterium]